MESILNIKLNFILKRLKQDYLPEPLDLGREAENWPRDYPGN